MISHNDDAFVSMLLTLALTADKEEISKPLSPAEFAALVARVKAMGIPRIGKLVSYDVTGMMKALDLEETEAFRLCMLLDRSMLLSYSIEHLYEQCVEFLTVYDEEYPSKMRARLGENTPPAMYVCGDVEILKKPMIGILGIGGVKLNEDTVNDLRALVRGLVDEGFCIVTSSELGACRVAETEAIERGGSVVCVLAGDLLARSHDMMYMDAIAAKKALLVSLVHPESPYTIAHAASRNRCVFAQSLASFIVSSDARRGETDAIRQKYCDWIYAFDIPKPQGNRLLIARGATPVRDMAKLSIPQYAANWRNAQAEQLSFF